jgi:uncharacterized phage protein (TIGR02218 family)
MLTNPVTSIAFGWRLERRDGITIGFTSHDQDVRIQGLLFRASPGMEPTSIVEKSGFVDGGLDIKGALTADAIAQKDVEAGRWDGAGLCLFTFDWTEPEDSIQILATGRLGAISHTGTQFETMIHGPSAVLGWPVAPTTSPSCRALFCGAECGLNAQRFIQPVCVEATTDSHAILSSGTMLASGHFVSGSLRWLEGANCGITTPILAHDAATLELAEAPPFPITAGTRAQLLQGCDRTAATCAQRFSNILNFRGEPQIPGNDLLTRYPGAN